jgi:hypothetical protein
MNISCGSFLLLCTQLGEILYEEDNYNPQYRREKIKGERNQLYPCEIYPVYYSEHQSEMAGAFLMSMMVSA